MKQEEINNIIDLYVNQKYSCRKIATIYNTSHNTISGILKNNNVFDPNRPINQKYSKADIEIISELYRKCNTEEIHKLYPELSTSVLYSLMSTNNVEYGNRWTDEEIEILKNNYFLSDEELFNLFNGTRSVCAIRTKCKKLGLVTRPMWTEEEIDVLKDGYSESIFEACKLLPHRSRNTIRRHARIYKLDKPKDRYKFRWSQEEDKYLQDNWEVMSDLELSQILNRTLASIQWRRKYLGFVRQGEKERYYSALVNYLRIYSHKWKEQIKQQYNSTCYLSGSKDVHIHHYISVNVIVKNIMSELGLEYYRHPSDLTKEQLNTIINRFVEEQDKSGGVCISKELHTLFHKIYGYKNTKEQFEQFATDYKSGVYNELLLKFA